MRGIWRAGAARRAELRAGTATASLAALLALTLGLPVVPAQANARSSRHQAHGLKAVRAPQAPDPVTSDFDGDGRSDLAIATPFDDTDGVNDGGSVTILYGSADGLTTTRARRFSQATQGILDAPAPGDLFGWTTAAGDFDGDGFGDLAIGALGEDLGPKLTDTGVVHVLYGSPTGLGPKRNQMWTGDSPDLPGAAGPADAFGSALATGDVNGDGAADLAIGVRGREVAGQESAGAVVILLGGDGGLSATGSKLFSQNTKRVLGLAEPSDMFGTGLAMGDLDRDGFDDLAVGVIGEDLGEPGHGVGDAGAVAILYGSDRGITAARDQLWTQDSPGVPGDAQNPDLMGASLAIGDFDGDHFGDLAADSFGQRVGGHANAGAITVLFGSNAGLTADGAMEITQATPDVPDTPQTNDQFGNPVAAADFDGDGRDELVAAVPNESVGDVLHMGAVYVMPGSPTGPTVTNSVLWTQDSPGVVGDAERNDAFGSAVAIGNFGRGGHPELAITVRRESFGTADQAGAAAVLYSTTTGLFADGNQLWTRNTPGVPGTAADGDWFGFALGAA